MGFEIGAIEDRGCFQKASREFSSYFIDVYRKNSVSYTRDPYSYMNILKRLFTQNKKLCKSKLKMKLK